MNYKETWKAEWENDSLHISGITDLFPNDFSTGTLNLKETIKETLIYEIVFHRDKEHFCDKDLVGSIHFFENNTPDNITKIKILDDTGEYSEIPIPNKTT